MWKKIKKEFYFGEKVKKYNIPVLNEREIRAGAGILFLIGIISFFVGCLGKNFWLVKIVGTYFLIDFIIRILINPKYSPSMILGRLFIKNQVPEYVGAPQKRFAWSIGLILAISFFISTVIFNYFGISTLILCLICLSFLFFESIFGICGGCTIYSKIFSKKMKYCPGGTCKIHLKEDIQKISKIQILILILSFILIAYFIDQNNIKREVKTQTQETNTTCSIQ